MYIVVTGAAGFIGSNLVRALNSRGETNILAVDNLTNGDKFRNLVDCEIADYLDKEHFRAALDAGSFDGEIAAILHQGACSDTMESDGRYMMENNYRYSSELLDYCQSEYVPLIYASSASVYGAGPVFEEGRVNEKPLNVYGYSKFLFDQIVRRRWDDNTAQVVGLRYFNVYGPREAHKARMASVAMHFFNQFRENGKVKLFEGSGGYAGRRAASRLRFGRRRGEGQSALPGPSRKIRHLQLRHGRVANLQRRCRRRPSTPCACAEGKSAMTLADLRAQGLIEYGPFPRWPQGQVSEFYRGRSRRSARRRIIRQPFSDVQAGVGRYVGWLLANR